MPLHQRWNSICLAERVGFEPTVPLLVHELSKLARSATLTPLQFTGPYFYNFYIVISRPSDLHLSNASPFLSEGMQKYQNSVNIAGFLK